MEATVGVIREILKRSPVEFIEMTHSYYHKRKKDLQLEGITGTLVKYAYPNVYKTPDYMSEEQWEATLANAAAKGTEVHNDIQDYCEKGTFPSTPEGLSWIEAEKEYNIEWIENEYLVSDSKHFASKIDILALVNGELSIIDIKRTSEIHYDTVTLQTSIYKMWFENTNKSLSVKHCYVFWAREDKWKLIELSIVSPDEIKSLVKAYLNNDETFVFNPLPTFWRKNKIQMISRLVREQKAIEKQISEFKKELKPFMEEFHHKGFQCNGARYVYIAPSVAKTFDLNRFKAENPELYEEYLTESKRDSSVRISI